MAIEEEIRNGFCKAQNQIRMVICEYEEKTDGSREFLSADCAYGKCPHTGDCLLMRSSAEGK